MRTSSRGSLASLARVARGPEIARGLPLVAIAAALALTGDLDRHPWRTLALLAAGFLWQALAVRSLEAGGPATPGTAARGILLVALLFRLPLLALPPTLSDDLLRYVWDGRVAAARQDPYRLPPDAAELAPLRDELWQRLPHRDVATVYPPLAVGLFSIAARTPWPQPVLKGALTAADLAACWLLIALARRRGVPEARAAWYAWSPLAAVETAGMGHVDALGVAAVLAAVLALSGRRGRPAGEGAARSPDRADGRAPVRSGEERAAAGTARTSGLPAALMAALAAAAGVLAKLVPLVALPMWARRSGRPALFLAAALVMVAAGLVPVFAGGVPPGLVTYGVSWEFNGPVYEPLWRAIDALGLDAAARSGLDRLEAWTGAWRAADPLYRFVYPQLLAKLLLAFGVLGAVAWSLSARDPVAGSRGLFGALLVLSPTVYPWYVLWVLPFAALTRAPAWLALAALVQLAYLPRLVPGVGLFPWVWLAIWGPFALLLLARPAARLRRRLAAREPAG
jgi:hypothetical protein